jgi:hypothetical protein
MNILLFGGCVTCLQVLHVQQVFYGRVPIINPSFFVPFRIEPSEYRFMGQTAKRDCRATENCILVDYVAMLELVLVAVAKTSLPFDYVYAIEDDTYYCGDSQLLGTLLGANQALNISILFSGIGASGYGIRMRNVPGLIAAARADSPDLKRSDRSNKFGADLLFWKQTSRISAREQWRTKVQLNVHLHQGSTRFKNLGQPTALFGTCFEFSCGMGPPNEFPVRTCAQYDLYSRHLGCTRSSRDILPVGFNGRHCIRERKLNASQD